MTNRVEPVSFNSMASRRNTVN